MQVILLLLFRLSEPGDLVAQARQALAEQAYERAAELATQATAEAPDDAEAWLLLGLARFRSGQPARAAPAFSRAAELAPESAIARFNLGSASFESGQYEAAEHAFVEAASRDEKVEPLAWLRAGLAAERAGRSELAEQHLRAALAAGGRAGATPIVEEARRLLDQLRARRATAAVQTLAHAGKAALLAGQPQVASQRYRDALALAERTGAPAADRAELSYGLGHALLRGEDAKAALAALEAATRLAPEEADFHFMLGFAQYWRELPGADAAARVELERALELGLSADDAESARKMLDGIASRDERPSARLAIDARAGAGYDSNVPQSGVIVTEPTAPALANADAPELLVDLDVLWRPIGTARDGLFIQYRFGQMAYLSSALDSYSLQEHDLGCAVSASPSSAVTVGLDVDGFALFSGVETFGPFQAGFGLGPRLTVREGAGLETRLRYQHTFKHALETGFESLSGDRDDLSLAEAWRRAGRRVSLGYAFRREAVGQQQVAVSDIPFPSGLPPAVSPTDIYVIPYSYQSHEAALSGSLWLRQAARVATSLRYERRGYTRLSGLYDPLLGRRFYPRTRVDDRVTADLGVLRPVGERYDLELVYTLIVNTSNIDNTDPATALDYDDKNYVKHMIELSVSARF